MTPVSLVRPACGALFLCLVGLRPAAAGLDAHESAAAPPSLVVGAALAPPPAGVAELRFADFFRRPIGPRGLEASERLLALDGRRVRIVGYMAAAALPMAGRLILAPHPVELGDEDEHLADDLPPQAVFVHLSGPAAGRILPHYEGLLALTGVLELGAREEPDGHVSAVRLILDAEASAATLPKAARARP